MLHFVDSFSSSLCLLLPYWSPTLHLTFYTNYFLVSGLPIGLMPAVACDFTRSFFSESFQGLLISLSRSIWLFCGISSSIHWLVLHLHSLQHYCRLLTLVHLPFNRPISILPSLFYWCIRISTSSYSKYSVCSPEQLHLQHVLPFLTVACIYKPLCFLM